MLSNTSIHISVLFLHSNVFSSNVYKYIYIYSVFISFRSIKMKIFYTTITAHVFMRV